MLKTEFTLSFMLNIFESCQQILFNPLAIVKFIILYNQLKKKNKDIFQWNIQISKKKNQILKIGIQLTGFLLDEKILVEKKNQINKNNK